MDNNRERNPEQYKNKGGKNFKPRKLKGSKPKFGETRRGEQGSKDSESKRVNFDNTRVGKFIQDVSKDNDPRWYFNKSELATSAVQIPFIHPTGLPERIPQTVTGQSGINVAVPGVMALQWCPTVNPRGKSAVSQAMDQIYSFVVHKNSRNYNYDPTDQMLLILGTSLAYSFLANAIRAYGVMLDWNGLDFYTPRALVTAMGFNYDDLSRSFHQMSFDINQRIAQLNQLWIPSTMPISERWFWMNSNIYRDAESDKAQYYLYTPATYYVYNPVAGEGWSTLDEKQWTYPNAQTHTWVEFTQAMDEMITALVNSQDRGIILGDLLQAYGPEKIYKLNPISQDYKTEVVYNREVLQQFENASIWGATAGTLIADVNGNIGSQGATISAQNLKNGSIGLGLNKMLNFHLKGTPTPSDIMVASRLSAMGTMILSKSGEGASQLVTLCPLSCGTELVANSRIYYYQWENGSPTLQSTSWNTAFKSAINSGSNFTGATMVQWFYMWAAFDWAPNIEEHLNPPVDVINSTPAGSTLQYNHRLDVADYDNYVYVQESQLNNLHTAAIYSLFDVPISL